MNRLVIAIAAVVAVLALTGGVVAFGKALPASSSSSLTSAGAVSTATPGGLGFKGMTPAQVFDHLRGAQLTYTDASGTVKMLKATPGTVTAVSSTGITITPNGATTSASFPVTSSTVVFALPDRGDIQSIVVGDKVVVVTQDTSTDALFIGKANPMYPYVWMGGLMRWVWMNAASVVSPSAATPSPTPGPGAYRRISPAQVFDHFRGAQLSYADASGALHTLTLTPGTVTAISTTSVSITPNGQTTSTSYPITSSTIVHAMPNRGDIQAIITGDKVVVATVDSSSDAMFIGKLPMMGMFGEMHGFMPAWGADMP